MPQVGSRDHALRFIKYMPPLAGTAEVNPNTPVWINRRQLSHRTIGRNQTRAGSFCSRPFAKSPGAIREKRVFRRKHDIQKQYGIIGAG